MKIIACNTFKSCSQTLLGSLAFLCFALSLPPLPSALLYLPKIQLEGLGNAVSSLSRVWCGALATKQILTYLYGSQNASHGNIFPQFLGAELSLLTPLDTA